MPLSQTILYIALGLDILNITVGIQWEIAGNVPAVIFLSFGNTRAWRVYVYVDIILLTSFWKGICRDCLILEPAKASGGTCLPATLCPGSYMQNCECLGCTFLRNGSTVLIRFPKRLAEMNHRYVTINILCWFLRASFWLEKHGFSMLKWSNLLVFTSFWRFLT